VKKVGIFINRQWEAAQDLARSARSLLADRVEEVWEAFAWDEEAALAQMAGTELLICLGGDGTMLWAARTVIPHPVALLGVNMGRLGFLAEVAPAELLERLPDVLSGRHRIEERAMLQAQVPAWGLTYHALNDVVIGRLSAGRPVYIDVSVDGCRLAFYRCDAVIVASATGSTAYSLSAGGPILHPESQELVITPVAPHLAAAPSLVVPPHAVIDLVVSTETDAVVSIDGQVDRVLATGEMVSVCRSPYVARFVRFAEPRAYYAMLAERFGLLRAVSAANQIELLNLKAAASD